MKPETLLRAYNGVRSESEHELGSTLQVPVLCLVSTIILQLLFYF